MLLVTREHYSVRTDSAPGQTCPANRTSHGALLEASALRVAPDQGVAETRRLDGEQKTSAATAETGGAEGEASEQEETSSGCIDWLGAAGQAPWPGLELGLYP